MHLRTWASGAQTLLIGLDLMFAGLVVLAMVQSAADTPARLWGGLGFGAALLAVYGVGRATIRVHTRPITERRGAWWPEGCWIALLVVLWAGFLWMSPSALWISFPLVLLQMHILGPHRGILVVTSTTALTVLDGVSTNATSGAVPIGFVLGPVLGAALAVGVILGFEALVREAQERQRTVEELSQIREHLAHAERDRVVHAERERLAREIHDTLAQGLSAIELLLRTAQTAVGTDDARAVDYIGQARTAAQNNLGEARRFVQALAPADLDNVTLVGALHSIASREQDPRLSVRVGTSGQQRALPVPVETALLRIAQSALANVVQHAEASHVEITLGFDDEDRVVLDVVDDGVGFDPSVAARPRAGRAGFGIAAMRSRVRELGGDLALESTPGEGTALAVSIPVGRPSATPALLGTGGDAVR